MPARVPLPRSSLTAARPIKTHVYPSPIPNESAMTETRFCFEAKASTRPIMMQLTTISGMKTPMLFERSGKYAFITRSTIVVNAAITMMNTGIRIAEGMSLRNSEIMTSEKRSTKVMARPMPMPFETFVVTAMAEQRPIINMSRGLSKIMPCLKIE
jgi:hypothetical protein